MRRSSPSALGLASRHHERWLVAGSGNPEVPAGRDVRALDVAQIRLEAVVDVLVEVRILLVLGVVKHAVLEAESLGPGLPCGTGGGRFWFRGLAMAPAATPPRRRLGPVQTTVKSGLTGESETRAFCYTVRDRAGAARASRFERCTSSARPRVLATPDRRSRRSQLLGKFEDFHVRLYRHHLRADIPVADCPVKGARVFLGAAVAEDDLGEAAGLSPGLQLRHEAAAEAVATEGARDGHAPQLAHAIVLGLQSHHAHDLLTASVSVRCGDDPEVAAGRDVRARDAGQVPVEPLLDEVLPVVLHVRGKAVPVELAAVHEDGVHALLVLRRILPDAELGLLLLDGRHY
ncbi:hypothetical protein ON010_g4541 [Phytophthora cinnamomi]|nr:hypothetical protein ON010_g4541 [Phytophthora cinnamomi]